MVVGVSSAVIGRVVVLGAGAVGGAIAALLAEAGIPVQVLARGSHLSAIRSDGLHLRMPDRTLCVHPTCLSHVEEYSPQPDDVALLSTKLGDAQAVLDAFATVAAADTPVVATTNGVAADRWVRQRFERGLSMMVWLPALHLRPGVVDLHSAPCRGVLDVGDADGPRALVAHALAEALGRAGFDSQARRDIMRWKYAKLIANLGGTAQALVTDDWTRVALAQRDEGERVLDAADIDRVPSDALIARCAHVADLPVGGATRPGGSTWQSQQRGRPLETPWLEGEIVALADRCGLPAPINNAVFAAGKAARPFASHDVIAD